MHLITKHQAKEAKLIELQRETEGSAIITEDFNIPVAESDRSSRQRIGKDILKSVTPPINWA